MLTQKMHNKPVVRLNENEKNVFHAIHKTSKVLAQMGIKADFEKRAYESESYEDLIELVKEYCEIK